MRRRTREGEWWLRTREGCHRCPSSPRAAASRCRDPSPSLAAATSLGAPAAAHPPPEEAPSPALRRHLGDEWGSRRGHPSPPRHPDADGCRFCWRRRSCSPHPRPPPSRHLRRRPRTPPSRTCRRRSRVARRGRRGSSGPSRGRRRGAPASAWAPASRAAPAPPARAPSTSAGLSWFSNLVSGAATIAWLSARTSAT